MPNTIPAAATGLPTRRTALASLAGLGAAISLPKVAKAAAVTADPTFAAIGRHKAAWAAFQAACEPCGMVVGRDPPHLVAALDAACLAEIEVRRDMHEVVPQTVAGLAAYVAYWHAFTQAPEGEQFGHLDEIGWEAIPTIAEAMAALFPSAGKGGAR